MIPFMSCEGGGSQDTVAVVLVVMLNNWMVGGELGTMGRGQKSRKETREEGEMGKERKMEREVMGKEVERAVWVWKLSLPSSLSVSSSLLSSFLLLHPPPCHLSPAPSTLSPLPPAPSTLALLLFSRVPFPPLLSPCPLPITVRCKP